MTNYRINIANRTYLVRIRKDELEVNGDPISYNLDSLDGKGQHVLRLPKRNVEAHLEAKQPGDYEVQIDGNHLNAKVAVGDYVPPQTENNDTGLLQAPMPGLIIDLLVEIGDQVSQGQTLIIQEAMKMQMKLRSPFDGLVTKISTRPGLQVEKGAELMLLQPAK